MDEKVVLSDLSTDVNGDLTTKDEVTKEESAELDFEALIDEEDSVANIDLDIDLDDVAEDTEDMLGGMDFDIDDVAEETNQEEVLTLKKKEEQSEETFSTSDYFDDGEDIASSEDYDFLREETVKFMSALKLTLSLRSNRVDTVMINKMPDIVSSEDIAKKFKRTKKNDNTQRNMYIDTIKLVLDVVRKYNDKKDLTILPNTISSRMQEFETLSYNDPDGRVFDEIDRQIRIKLSDGDNAEKKLSKYMSDVSQVRVLYQKICSVYDKMDADEYMSKMNNRKNEYRDKIEFEFYNWILEYLDSPNPNNPEHLNTVALCNHLYYTTGDNVEFQFQCGKCGNIVNGATSIEVNDNKEIYEGDTHAFYQYLTVGGRGLYYPLVCEECGAVNCFSSSTRKLIDDGMLRDVTEGSKDDIDYRDTQRSGNAKMIVAGDRRLLPYTKYMDLLKTKIDAGENGEMPDLDDTRTECMVEDSQFFIEINSEVATDGILDDINDNEYREAIIAFRKHNDIMMEKKEIDNITNQDEADVKLVLSLVSHSGDVPSLRNIFESIAGYIMSTECAKELESCRNAKNDLYNSYLTFLGYYKLATGDTTVDDVQKNEFKQRYGAEWNVQEIKKMLDVAQHDYEEALTAYEASKMLLFDNPKVFALRKKEYASNSLVKLAELFECDDYFPVFMKNVMCETIQNKLVSDMRIALGVKNGGSRVALKKVQGIKNINDREHIMMNKLTEVLEYCKRVQGKYGKFEENGQVKQILQELHKQCYQYEKYCEWRDRFGFSDGLEFNNLKTRKNYDDILKCYNMWLAPSKGDIEEYNGKRLGELIPKFSDSEVFDVLFGSNVRDDAKLLKDARDAFGVLLHTPEYRIFDIVASKIIINNIGYQQYSGMSNLDIARYLKLTNGSALNAYKVCEDSLNRACNNESRVKYRIRKMIEHDYVMGFNNPSDISCLRVLIDQAEDEDAVKVDSLNDDMSRQLDLISREIGDAENFEMEFATQEMINTIF